MAAEWEMPAGFDFFDMGDTDLASIFAEDAEGCKSRTKHARQSLRHVNFPAPIAGAGVLGDYCSTSRRRAALPFNARR